jgi:ATP-dependent DNA ligase
MAKRVSRVRSAAEKSEMPGFIKPQLATLKTKAPKGDQWLHEIKFDGYRVQVHLSRGKKKGLHPQRAGLDQTIFPDRRLPRYSRPRDH